MWGGAQSSEGNLVPSEMLSGLGCCFVGFYKPDADTRRWGERSRLLHFLGQILLRSQVLPPSVARSLQGERVCVWGGGGGTDHAWVSLCPLITQDSGRMGGLTWVPPGAGRERAAPSRRVMPQSRTAVGLAERWQRSPVVRVGWCLPALTVPTLQPQLLPVPACTHSPCLYPVPPPTALSLDAQRPQSLPPHALRCGPPGPGVDVPLHGCLPWGHAGLAPHFARWQAWPVPGLPVLRVWRGAGWCRVVPLVLLREPSVGLSPPCTWGTCNPYVLGLVGLPCSGAHAPPRPMHRGVCNPHAPRCLHPPRAPGCMQSPYLTIKETSTVLSSE